MDLFKIVMAELGSDERHRRLHHRPSKVLGEVYELCFKS